MARIVARYLVVRTRDVLGYQEFFGPLVSTPQDVKDDANRLYGKPGHTVSWRPWSRVPQALRNLAVAGDPR